MKEENCRTFTGEQGSRLAFNRYTGSVSLIEGQQTFTIGAGQDALRQGILHLIHDHSYARGRTSVVEAAKFLRDVINAATKAYDELVEADAESVRASEGSAV